MCCCFWEQGRTSLAGLRALFAIAGNCPLLEVHVLGEGAGSCRVGFSRRPPLCAVPVAPTACRTNSLLSPFGPDSQCLQDLCISEESLDAPVVDNDCLVCVAQVECTQLPTRFACVSMAQR